jgi:hypothetical protein
MSRIGLLLLTVLAVAAIAAPSAPAKTRCAHGHSAKAKRCKKPKAKKKPAAKTSTPLSVTLLDGSTATLDLGNGNVRTTAVTGTLKAAVPGGYRLGHDNTIVLTGGRLAVAPTDVLTDDCAAPPIARTDPATAATLAPGTKSSAVVHANGTVTGAASVVLRTVLDFRSGPCGSAPATSGYADTPLTVALHGAIQMPTGLNGLTLDSGPQPVTLQGCLAPGTPTTKCAGAPLAYPATLSTHLVVKVVIGG